MRHVMVDIETLGVSPGSVILSIGACDFGADGVHERFYRPIDVFDSLMAGLSVDPKTVDWWRAQSAEARGALSPARPLRDTLAAFALFVTGGVSSEPMLWAKGPDFDLVLLGAAYEAVGQRRPWKYNRTRDVRTILALASGVSVPSSGVKHNALADAVYQAELVIEAAAKLCFPLAKMA